MKNKNILVIVFILFTVSSCKKYLDVVPDNVATIDNAFSMRNTAEKYLFTCYSWLPKNGSYAYDPAMMGADEMWGRNTEYAAILKVKGFQNVVNPYFNYWSGPDNTAPGLFMAIRDCNIFLENIDRVVELDDVERARWKAEVKFLKAYYHFYLLRAYGPIPLIKENLPINVNLDDAKVERKPIDECINYIVSLLDEASPDLPVKIQAEENELGRITKPIALAMKAKVLVTAASPLFNGNPDYANFKSSKGVVFFNQMFDKEKWKLAADAVKAAIDAAHLNGNKLYYYSENDQASTLVSSETNFKMNVRNSITAKWNPEIIWANPNNLVDDNQKQAQARLDGSISGLAYTGSTLSATMKLVETFYTNHGLPIKEDNSWDYQGRFDLKTAGVSDRFNIKEGYKTVNLHFNRELRFYADIAFDGGIWYGQGNKTEVNNWYVQAKLGQYSGNIQNNYSPTGYWPKKLVNVENVYSATVPYTIVKYPFVEIRLADLYLLYAEALNEYYGPSTDAYYYIDLVRARAGLQGVVNTWTSSYSTNQTKHTTQTGLRQIIQQERAIELVFEAQRYWDLKRWKLATSELTYPIKGWNTNKEDAENYYTPITIYNRTFKPKDYFEPIRELDLVTNSNLVQNPGW